MRSCIPLPNLNHLVLGPKPIHITLIFLQTHKENIKHGRHSGAHTPITPDSFKYCLITGPSPIDQKHYIQFHQVLLELIIPL